MFCECGCGQKTNLATQTNRQYGHIVGQPVRFRLGHACRGRTCSIEGCDRKHFGHGYCRRHYKSVSPEGRHQARQNHRVQVLKKYGLTPEEFDAMASKQGNVCAICDQSETRVRHGEIQRLTVDHDHDTGKVRGLLCGRCNTSIGQMEDDAYLLLRAYQYLKEHSGNLGTV